MATLNGLLDRAAQEGGCRPFLVHEERTLSFADTLAEVLSICEGLRRWGLRKGDRVAILHRNSPEFVASYFALSRLGAIAVPINFMVQKPAELAYMLRDCGAVGAITQREFLSGLSGAAKTCPELKALWVTDAPASPIGLVRDFSELRQNPPPGWAPDPVIEGDVAAILYTSGTTGFPKGVMLTHRNLVSNCESSIKGIALRRGDITMCILPMFHSFAWTALVLTATRLTLKLVISSSIAPARPWLKAMGRHGVTLFAAVPQVYAALSREARHAAKARWLLKYWAFRKVHIAVSGAAPLAPAVAQSFFDSVGIALIEGWGLTETSPVATISSANRIKPGFVGTPIEGCSLKVIDEDENELPRGCSGEICVKGENVMKGYWHLPDATRETFTHDGWLKTGDVGFIDETGCLAIRDRIKDMIIIKGLKVFSAQVEAVIAEHPDVAEAAIIGVPDEAGDELIKAFVVLKKGASPDKTKLLQFFKDKFDPYKRPRDVEFLDALPKNALQKVLKRELRERESPRRATVGAS